MSSRSGEAGLPTKGERLYRVYFTLFYLQLAVLCAKMVGATSNDGFVVSGLSLFFIFMPDRHFPARRLPPSVYSVAVAAEVGLFLATRKRRDHPRCFGLAEGS